RAARALCLPLRRMPPPVGLRLWPVVRDPGGVAAPDPRRAALVDPAGGQRAPDPLRLLPDLRLATLARAGRRGAAPDGQGRLARPAGGPGDGDPHLDRQQAARRRNPDGGPAIPGGTSRTVTARVGAPGPEATAQTSSGGTSRLPSEKASAACSE